MHPYFKVLFVPKAAIHADLQIQPILGCIVSSIFFWCSVCTVVIDVHKTDITEETASKPLVLGGAPGVCVQPARRHRLVHAEGEVGQEERHSALGYVVH